MPKLHIGCFDNPVPGWTNTDITPHLWVARIPYAADVLHGLRLLPARRYEQHKAGVFRAVSYMNITRKFPFPNDHFSAVFSSHVLEHIPTQSIGGVLDEIFRVLSPGGVVRVVLPDLDQFIGKYDPANPDVFLMELFEAKQSSAKNRHHWMYNATSIMKLLEEHRFAQVKRWSYRQGECEDVERIDNRPENSLYVEGKKPA